MDTLGLLSECEGKSKTEISKELNINASTLKGMLSLAFERGEVEIKKRKYCVNSKGLETYVGWKPYESFSKRLEQFIDSKGDKDEKK